jgi:c-di-GMP-binding flagellar brake protein YcgR
MPGVGEILARDKRASCYVGVSDRSLELDLPCLGTEEIPVGAQATLNTVLFGVPEKAVVTQRRRAFRIDLMNPVPVEIETLSDDCTTSMWFTEEQGNNGIQARLVNLSFSGARLTGDKDSLCPAFAEGGRVRLRIFLPDSISPLQVIGLVRRSNSKLSDRDLHQDELGVEFLVSPEIDRDSIDTIRQFVLREQRSLLARRVHVSS